MKSKSASDKVIAFIFVGLSIIVAIAVVLYVVYVVIGSGTAGDIARGCKELPIIKSPKMAVIRIDDIQAYSLEDMSIRMLNDAKTRHIPVSLGVIPIGIEDKTPIYDYLVKNACWLEIAQHGWDHQGDTPEEAEFQMLSYSAAANEISKGTPVLERIAGEPVVTFIPPLNLISSDARKAVKDAGMPILSSEGSGEFDYDATTFSYSKGSLNSAETVVRDCEQNATRSAYCIVMVHPQDFVTNNAFDPIKYEIYLDTLDRLKATGYTFVRFKDLIASD